MSEDLITYPIRMTSEVATYWYARFHEFKAQNEKDFADLSFADYIGTQVLANMMRLFLGKVPR